MSVASKRPTIEGDTMAFMSWWISTVREHARQFPHLDDPPNDEIVRRWNRMQRARVLRQRDRARKALQAAQATGRPHLAAVR